MVFLAEVADPPTVADLVARAHAASSPDRPRTAVSVGRLIVLFVGGSTTANEAPLETSASLDRFSNIVGAWLAARTSG